MPLYLIPIIVLIVNQIIKLISESVKHKFSWNHLLNNGGMPSSHSSFVISATTVIYLSTGLNSAVFTLAFVIALIIIWDAFTTRQQIGYQGNIINKLIKELPDEKEYKYPLINEQTGHSFSEVLVGVILGFVLSYLLYLI